MKKEIKQLQEKAREKYFEKLADIEHQRWANWQMYLHKHITEKEGELTLPKESVNRWEGQIQTPYEKLTENEKDSDREEVEKYWHIIDTLIEQTYKQRRGDVLKEINEKLDKIENRIEDRFDDIERDISNLEHNLTCDDCQ